MRLFIATAFQSDYFRSLQDQLPDAKLSKTKSFHLTYKFLGDVGEDLIPNLKDRLASVAFQPFSVTANHLGFFPDEKKPRVVWVGFTEAAHIISLQKEIDAALDGLFPREQRFHPHVTLARVKFFEKDFADQVKKIKISPQEFSIEKFGLIRSTLTPEGPVYETL